MRGISGPGVYHGIIAVVPGAGELWLALRAAAAIIMYHAMKSGHKPTFYRHFLLKSR